MSRKSCGNSPHLLLAPFLEVGVNTEREEDGVNLTGPTFELEVPLFNRKQGDIARLKAQIRQKKNQLIALERDIQSEIRMVRDRILVARTNVQYYLENIIPNRVQLVELSQKHYNYMLLGSYTLLEAKQDELIARRDYSEALKSYWIARSDLERVIGGWLPMDLSAHESNFKSMNTSPKVPMVASHQHHHHGGKSL